VFRLPKDRFDANSPGFGACIWEMHMLREMHYGKCIQGKKRRKAPLMGVLDVIGTE